MPASRPPKGLVLQNTIHGRTKHGSSDKSGASAPVEAKKASIKPQIKTKTRAKRGRNDHWRTNPAITVPRDAQSKLSGVTARQSQGGSADKPKRSATKKHKKGTPTGRVACAAVPLFPLAARLRCEPDLFHEAVAVCDGSGSTSRVIAASRKARRAGVRPGMTLTQARARCPKLIARSRDPECENTAQEVLLEIAESFSPRVEEPNSCEEAISGLDADSKGFSGDGLGGFGGVVYLDIHGLDRHYKPNGKTKRAQRKGTDTAEFRLGRELMRQLDAVGLPAKVGIASSKLAARVAAGFARTALPPPDEPGAVISEEASRARIEPMIVEQGDEADFLAPLPLRRLSPQSETAHTLERWGIERVGDFAQLPRAEVRSRLGEIGHRLHLIARGIDPRPLIARTPTHNMREGLSLEWPIANLEPFLFIARAALERLCDRLTRRGLGCKRLEMSLQLEPDGFHERSIELPSPTREAKTLLTLVRLDLEAHTPTAPIVRFQFTAQPDTPRLAQMSLFGPAALSPDRLATTIARLFALLGPQRVGSPRPAAGHLPERFALEEYRPPPPPKVRRRVEPGRGLLAVRVLRPPVEIEVLTNEPAPNSENSEGIKDNESTQLLPISKEFENDGFNKPVPSQQDPSRTRPTSAPSPTDGSGSSSSSQQNEYKQAFERAESSGVQRGASTEQTREENSLDQAEGLGRQHGLFRPSQRYSYRPCQISSEQIAEPLASYASGADRLQQQRKREERKIRIHGKVRIASGPWELEEKWWLEERTERDYWDVELSDGALYRIFRDRENGKWFADGIYD